MQILLDLLQLTLSCIEVLCKLRQPCLFSFNESLPVIAIVSVRGSGKNEQGSHFQQLQCLELVHNARMLEEIIRRWPLVWVHS